MLELGKREWHVAYAAALDVLRTPDQAEDAAQDAMLRAFRARSSFRGRSPDRWLGRIARNTAISHLRRPAVRRHVDADVVEVLDGQPSRETPLAAALASELIKAARAGLANMRALDRTAFEERFILGASERELGEKLGVSCNAARQRAFRARRQLRMAVSEAGLGP